MILNIYLISAMVYVALLLIAIVLYDIIPYYMTDVWEIIRKIHYVIFIMASIEILVVTLYFIKMI